MLYPLTPEQGFARDPLLRARLALLTSPPGGPSAGPEAAAVVDDAAAGGPAAGVPTVTASRARPVTVDRSHLVAPVYDRRRANLARLVGGVASGVGIIGALATGGDSPLSALASGVAGGAGARLGEIDADYARLSAAYAEGIGAANIAEAGYRNDFENRQGQMAREVLSQQGQTARNDADNASAQARLGAQIQATADIESARQTADRYEFAVEAGDPDGAALAAEAMGMDPAVARAQATRVRDRQDAGDALAARREARTAALGWFNAQTSRLSAQASMISATRPRAADGGGGRGGGSGQTADTGRQRMSDWSSLIGLRRQLRDGEITQADYDEAERLFDARWGAVPGDTEGAATGATRSLFGTTPAVQAAMYDGMTGAEAAAAISQRHDLTPAERRALASEVLRRAGR